MALLALDKHATRGTLSMTAEVEPRSRTTISELGNKEFNVS